MLFSPLRSFFFFFFFYSVAFINFNFILLLSFIHFHLDSLTIFPSFSFRFFYKISFIFIYFHLISLYFHLYSSPISSSIYFFSTKFLQQLHLKRNVQPKYKLPSTDFFFFSFNSCTFLSISITSPLSSLTFPRWNIPGRVVI